MGYQQHSHRLSQVIAVAVILSVIVLSGCAGRIQQRLTVCPGKKSVAEALSSLRLRSQNIMPLKANGRCSTHFYVDGREYKENFQAKVWMNPPTQFRLQGEVFLNPRGIILGSNTREFWLSIKPREISGYWWGQWSEQSGTGKLTIGPEVVLESFGIVEISDDKDWFLSKEDAFDILTKRDEGIELQKIYISNCDYLISKIEYFGSAGKAAGSIELGKYRKVRQGFWAPTTIKIIIPAKEGRENLIKITLRSIKPVEFTKKKEDIFFNRPQPCGFKNVYKIVDGNMFEQRN